MLPPLVGVVLNVTEFPRQIEVEFAVMETAGVTEEAVMIIELLATVAVVIQFALLVITTEIASPLLREELVKVDEVAPVTSDPLIFH